MRPIDIASLATGAPIAAASVKTWPAGCHGRVPVVAGGSWTLRPLDAAFVLLADGVARDHRLQTARCARESARACVHVRVWARTRAAFVHARVSVRVRAEGARGERGTTGDACDLGIMH